MTDHVKAVDGVDLTLKAGHTLGIVGESGSGKTTLARMILGIEAPSGGRLAFETRDPDDRRWERWNPVDSRRVVALPDGRGVTAWTEVTEVTELAGTTATLVHHYVFPDGEELRSTATMRFRTEAEVRTSLGAAGFSVEAVHGGWVREPVGQGDGELLVIARR